MGRARSIGTGKGFINLDSYPSSGLHFIMTYLRNKIIKDVWHGTAFITPSYLSDPKPPSYNLNITAITFPVALH